MTQQKIYKEVSSYLKKGTKFLDVRHIVTLAWMIAAVIGSKSVNQAEWGSYVQSRAQKEDSNQKRWRRFLNNGRVKVEKIYVPLILQAISELKEERLYLALDTTVLWNKYCFVYLSVVVWSFDNDYVERGKAGQRIPGWNWEEKSGDEKEKVSLSGFFRGTFSAFSDERTRRLITTRFS